MKKVPDPDPAGQKSPDPDPHPWLFLHLFQYKGYGFLYGEDSLNPELRSSPDIKFAGYTALNSNMKEYIETSMGSEQKARTTKNRNRK